MDTDGTQGTDGKLILVTGATGYIGGRLVTKLVADGRRVRVIVRSPQKLKDVPWAGSVDIVQGDLQDEETMRTVTQGVDTLYYLVHSMGSGRDFDKRESAIAATVSEAAAAAGARDEQGGVGGEPRPARGQVDEPREPVQQTQGEQGDVGVEPGRGGQARAGEELEHVRPRPSRVARGARADAPGPRALVPR